MLTDLPRERYLLGLHSACAQQSPIRQVLELLGSSAYRATVAALAGCEAEETGRTQGAAAVFAR